MKPLNLCLLDLDHTLIYGSYAPSEKADILFQYSEYLKVYKRPFVNQFVAKLSQSYNDIIVIDFNLTTYMPAANPCVEIVCVFILFARDLDITSLPRML